MSGVPVLMVLYTNDVAEVRYSDGSRLQLSPCGSNFVHHESPGEGFHPIHGLKSVHQRTRFATSDYKQKVLQALDFRNRFAERPYVCEELIDKDQIVPLYAKVCEVAWGKTLDETSCEYLPDGGIRLISEDEYASLVLSPHQRDFTVCYLSRLGYDVPKSPKQCSISAESANKEPDVRLSHKDKQDELCSNLKEDLSISPISEASGSPHTPPRNQNENVDFQRFSTPTKNESNLAEDGEPVVTPYGKTAVFPKFIQSGQEKSYNSAHSKDKVSTSISTFSVSEAKLNPKSNASTGSTECESKNQIDQSKTRYLYTWMTRHISCDECPLAWSHPVKLSKEAIDKTPISETINGQSLLTGQLSRKLPKKIARENHCMSVLPHPIPLTCVAQHLHRLHAKIVHDDTKDHLDNLIAFRQGRLKVLLVEGVIYRVVRLPTLKVIEIFPGDGSVIVSQGVSGQFFSHVMYREGKLEERSYTMKSPPPTPPNAAYSIEKLIKRGFRFLNQANQDDKILSSDDLCCWKREDTKLMEPLPTSLLEECTVPGFGRFSAYSNGHVRILFDDRTALDMTFDFSGRVQSCMQHSSEVAESHSHQDVHLSGTPFPSNTGFCKLLLPNTQCHLVDIQRPGIYRRYTDVAVEWASWVNTSPMERKLFYHNKVHDAQKEVSVEKELQKISCFNYIVENTVLGQQPQHSATLMNRSYETMASGQERNLQAGGNGSTQMYHSYPPRNSAFLPYEAHGQKNRPEMSSVPNSATVYKVSTSRHGMLPEFNSVREALLRTSKVISDIDEILDRRS